jgi:uncharacterized tellurite resistance protein B-like protein
MGLFDLFDSKEKKRRMSHMLNLITVACADGKLEQSEIDIILQIGTRLGVSADELRRIIERPGSISFTAPDNDRDRIALLYDMVLVMLVNGDIDENEVLYCKNTAVRLGLSSKVIDVIVVKIIELAKQHVETDKAVDDLIQVSAN